MSGIWTAAAAGLLSFASPCLLPLVPFYLCYLGGITLAELRADDMPARMRRHLMLAALFFAAGVTTIFVFLGLGASALGQLFLEWHQILRWVGALIIALLGLGLLGIPLPRGLSRFGHPLMGRRMGGGGILPAYLGGLAFGFGWTPCVGPALAAILVLAAQTGQSSQGALLLLVYGLAMTLPFVLIAGFSTALLPWLGRHRQKFARLQPVMGLGLILFAALLAFDRISLIAQWMLERGEWRWLLN